MTEVALVIPVFNEFGVIENTHAKIRAVINMLPYIFRIYYVEDGSVDGTGSSLEVLAAQHARTRVLSLSRNFGHQAALPAGLDENYVKRQANHLYRAQLRCCQR
jgi:dolichol-phosphate mannosyltransferase